MTQQPTNNGSGKGRRPLAMRVLMAAVNDWWQKGQQHNNQPITAAAKANSDWSQQQQKVVVNNWHQKQQANWRLHKAGNNNDKSGLDNQPQMGAAEMGRRLVMRAHKKAAINDWWAAAEQQHLMCRRNSDVTSCVIVLVSIFLSCWFYCGLYSNCAMFNRSSAIKLKSVVRLPFPTQTCTGTNR
jgi:hypothetical protein